MVDCVRSALMSWWCCGRRLAQVTVVWLWFGFGLACSVIYAMLMMLCIHNMTLMGRWQRGKLNLQNAFSGNTGCCARNQLVCLVYTVSLLSLTPLPCLPCQTNCQPPCMCVRAARQPFWQVFCVIGPSLCCVMVKLGVSDVLTCSMTH